MEPPAPPGPGWGLPSAGRSTEALLGDGVGGRESRGAHCWSHGAERGRERVGVEEVVGFRLPSSSSAAAAASSQGYRRGARRELESPPLSATRREAEAEAETEKRRRKRKPRKEREGRELHGRERWNGSSDILAVDEERAILY